MTYTPDATKAAASVRRRFGLSSKPRVSALTSIAHGLGSLVVASQSRVIAGAIGPSPGCLPGMWEISLDQSLRSHRLRFALAHELGHLWLRINEWEPRSEERWCNEFAAELLMPSECILSHYGSAEQSLATINDLVRTYDVSRSASLVRLRRLLHWDRALVALQLREGRWKVVRMTAMPQVALYALEPLAREVDILRGGRIFRDWLPFAFRGERIEILCEYVRQGRWVENLMHSSDLVEVCDSIASEQSDFGSR